jgi:biofilm PGA synthesis N-glycosyltransferase PgaC
LRENAGSLRDVRARRMWPVWIEGLLSTLWSHLFFAAAILWTLALATGVYGFAGDPIPNFWGLLMATILVVQITLGLRLDGRYDRSVRRYAFWIPIYPLAYWMLSAAAAVRGTLPGLVQAPSTAPVTWEQPRYDTE